MKVSRLESSNSEMKINKHFEDIKNNVMYIRSISLLSRHKEMDIF